MQSLIALDLETTGLDFKRDTVIEIGVVRFRGSRVEDTWETLVNPGRPLSALITSLTGINDDMLANAPRLSSVLEKLEDFVGDLPILGHNINFDLRFLQPEGLFQYNQSLDTYDLASVLLPNAGRYNLAGLASQLGVPLRTAHRALDDAQTTRLVFIRLFEEALQLPIEIVQEIAHLGSEVEWGAGWVFDEVLQSIRESGLEIQEESDLFREFFPHVHARYETLIPVREPHALDIEELAAVLEPGGPFAKQFPAYEHRPQQITMLREVASAFSESRHLLVEAGTGIGKSMAYLLPAFSWATQNRERVVISTNTINLQEQLIHKDIPDLSRTLGIDFRAAVLKGRSNYICPRRLAGLRLIRPRTADEMRVLAKILLWLYNGGSGDRGEINLLPREIATWTDLSAEGQDCSAQTCPFLTDGKCPYYQAHEEAESAHVVIVNHALLLADIATGNRVIPEYRYLIVDEAHHLESATTRGMSFQVSRRNATFLLRDLGSRSSGLLGRVLEVARTEISPEEITHLEKAVKVIVDRAKECSLLMQRTFDSLSEFMTQKREGKPIGIYGHRERVVPSSRTLPEWTAIEIAWDDLRGPLKAIVEALINLSEGFGDIVNGGSAQAEGLAQAVRITAQNLEQTFMNLDNMIFEPDPQTIYWLEAQAHQDGLSFHAAPLDVGPLVERFLWHEKESVVMTSATLTTGGEFNYIRRRLNAEDADEMALGSPFDYETSTLLYLVNDIPEPADRHAYQRAVERGLTALCLATHGRALILFTSNEQLRRTARAITQPLNEHDIQVYEQRTGASRHMLLESFRDSEQAVLLGTRSFWEGVDVPGEALSVLAIVRLPFDVPNDPIIAARSETFEAPFYEYTVPEAVLRFRQGFGRLIRSQSDRGIVVVLDRRILSKQYGKAFIDSLPRCTLRAGSLADLPKAAERWLGI
jgi:ATP-dependent DNA helicase DinG